MITINGHEFDFSFSDMKDARRWRKALGEVDARKEEILAAANKVEQGEDALAMLDSYIEAGEKVCHAYLDLIDDTLGEGTCNTVFGENIENFAIITEFYQQFVASVNAEMESMLQGVGALVPVGKKGK